MTVATLNIPPGIPSDGTVRVDFVPAGGFEDYTTPTVAEVTGATAQHLTCHIFPVAPTGTVQRNTKRRMCSKQAYEILGSTEYTVEDIRYVYDVQNPESYTHEAYAALVPGIEGYLVFRWGIDVGADPEAEQVVDVFPVRLGPQIKLPPEENDELMTSQSVAITGDVATDVELAA